MTVHRGLATLGTTLLLVALAATARSAAPGDTGTVKGASDAGIPTDAGASKDEVVDGGVPETGTDAPEATALDALAQRLELLDQQLQALRALGRGTLPERDLTCTALLGIDLTDDAAVTRRRLELGRELEAKQNTERTPELVDAGSDAGTDGGIHEAPPPRSPEVERREQELRQLEREVAEAQIALLSKPAWERRRIAEAEAERARNARQQEAAEAERNRAAEEAVAAEEARQRALVEAEQARSAAQRAIASERARAEQVRRDQARMREEISSRRSQDASASSARQARIFELVDAAEKATPGASATDALYGRIMSQLEALKPDTEAALREVSSRAEVPRYNLPADLPTGSTELGRERQELLSLAETLVEGERALILEARRLSSERMNELLAGERELNRSRVQLLGKLSQTRRDEVLGLGPEGGAQLGWEAWHVGARARWYALTRDDLGHRARAALRDPYVIGALITRGAPVLLVLAAAFYAFRRRRRIVDRSWTAASRVIRRPPLLRAIQRALDVLAALSPELIFLAAIWGIHGALGPVASFPEAQIAYELLIWYGLYRLCLNAAHRSIKWLSSTPNAPIREATSAKVLRSLRFVGRYALGVRVVLSLTAALVGEAFIHHQVRRFAWLGAIPIFLTLIRRWRGDIADAYLRLITKGALADAVRSTRDRWYGFFIAVAAFGVILLAGASSAARRFVLGFEQSRKVLAYLFRKRLERRAEEDAPRFTALGLPPDLVACFSEEPLSDPSEGIDRFPDLERFSHTFSTWRGGGRTGSMLIVGGAGAGKSSWLAAAAQRAEGVPQTRVPLPRRITSPGELYAQLGAALGAPHDARTSADALATWIRAQEPQLIVLDHAERLILRGTGAWGAWDALERLIEQVRDGAFWLCTMDLYAFHYLRFARQSEGAFRATVHLPRWTEQEIAALVHSRNARSGYSISYDDLLLEEVGGHEREARLVSTEQDYMRLLWDHANGSPRVALHFWLRSLVPDGDGQVRVRLFRSPYEDDLEALDEPSRFVLASVVWHGDVSPEEAEFSLRYPVSQCEAALVRLEELGVLAEDERRYRVTTRWQGAVNGFLLRKHLIEP
ncbi:AAA family ATPase [Chondromyces crocatus]|uniref:ORC1/DEAH AAA+ ATPase domain-containing protein n=1 Tax=Chondromyces crocatus TaxID=52 RepID=A0A0K1E816_CHOCO|nr:AAA family ATPase [Chondromyces crocatus]AKT37005.1 uncharacterized protein CMC5_011310 [Chondromyces crocatus]